MRLFRNIIFSLSILLPILSLLDILSTYFFNIEIVYGILIWYWLAVFIVNLFIVFGSKIKFFSSLFFGLAFITLSIYQLLNIDFYRRKQIDNTNYQIEAYRGYYKIVETYILLEKTIAQNPSEIFSTNNTKTGVVSWFEVKLLAETENKLVLEITSGIFKQRDTLVKREFWSHTNN